MSVSLRRADVRLLANGPVTSVRLLGCDELAPSFEAAGLAIEPVAPDLVVASLDRAVEAAQVGAACTVVLGDARRRLRSVGDHGRLVLVRPGPDGPRLLVPLDQPDAVHRALLAPEPGRGSLKRLLVRAALTARRLGFPTAEVLTVVHRGDARPAFVAAAQAVGVPVDATWHLAAGEGDDLQRLVWICGRPGRQEPRWAIKSSRVAGYRAPFDLDEEALGWVAATPAPVRDRAPRFLGRVVVGDLHGSVETAAAGTALHDVARRSADPLALVRAVARWAIALGVTSTGEVGSLEEERTRLEQEVLPGWADAGVDQGLVRALPALRPVGQHGDLGLWNIVGSDEGWTVVDWESARRAGLPLWDVVYFATDALAYLDDPAGGDDHKLEAMVALLRGEHRWSGELFALVQEAADASEVPAAAIGSIVTLGWLHHAGSDRRRTDRQAAAGVASAAPVGVLPALAERWVADDQLGPAWPAFADRP